MESARSLPVPRKLPWWSEAFIAAVLLPFESFFAAHTTETVCRYIDVYTRRYTNSDDLLIFAFLLAPFIFIEGIKKAIDMRLVIVVISSLVLISVRLPGRLAPPSLLAEHRTQRDFSPVQL
jgi:hypothetical protein